MNTSNKIGIIFLFFGLISFISLGTSFQTLSDSVSSSLQDIHGQIILLARMVVISFIGNFFIIVGVILLNKKTETTSG